MSNTSSIFADGTAQSLPYWLPVYRSMFTSREVDRQEVEFVRRGLAHFHVAGAGHEITAYSGGRFTNGTAIRER